MKSNINKIYEKFLQKIYRKKEYNRKNSFAKIVYDKKLIKKTSLKLYQYQCLISEIKKKYMIALILWRNNIFKKVFNSLILFRQNKRTTISKNKDILEERNNILSIRKNGKYHCYTKNTKNTISLRKK